MAMEVNAVPKRLHVHVAPIIMIVTAILSVSLVSTYQYVASGEGTSSAIAKGLITSVVKVEPKSNGLADITVNKPEAKSTQVKAGSSLDGTVSQAGRSAQISLIFQ